MEHADLFEERVIKEMHKRGKASILKPIVFISDGAAWIWYRIKNMAENRVKILDFYHATEHLSGMSKIIFGENEKGDEWYVEWRKNILRSTVNECIIRFQDMLTVHKRYIILKL